MSILCLLHVDHIFSLRAFQQMLQFTSFAQPYVEQMPSLVIVRYFPVSPLLPLFICEIFFNSPKLNISGAPKASFYNMSSPPGVKFCPHLSPMGEHSPP
jgi:hypothetical protein